MTESVIFFQWQNEYLLQTIYPLRETKFRDFLTFYFEVEIWKKYRDKTPQDIMPDVLIYCETQKARLEKAYQDYHDLEAYLLDDDVTDLYQQQFQDLDLDVMNKINNIHKAFKTYYPNYKNPVKEKYFTSARINYCEELRKNVQFQISEKQRIIRNMGPGWLRKPDYEKAIEQLSTIALPMVQEELSKLYAFLSAYERLGKYRQELAKRKLGKEKEKSELLTRLKATQAQVDTVRSQLAIARILLNRLTHPPEFEPLKNYFLDEGAADTYFDRFPDPDPAVLVKIKELHRVFNFYFPGYNNPVKERFFITQRIQEFENLNLLRSQELNDRKRSAGWINPQSPAFSTNENAIKALRDVTLPMINAELVLLQDFLWAFDHVGKPIQELSSQIEQSQKEVAGFEERLNRLLADEASFQANLNSLNELLDIPEKDQILAFIEPRFVTVAEVVRSLIDNYKQELSEKSHQELLEIVVNELVTNANRYPLWLHYMVIHFSGMRYQSAHGSWADPKDLLLTLRTRTIQQELKNIKDDAIEALCEQKYLCYLSRQTSSTVLEDGSEQTCDLPALALTTDPEWLNKIKYHLKALNPTGGYYKRKALMDIRIEEADYEIEKYTDQQTIEALEAIQNLVPDWMWKEIVKVTDLRLKEVTSAKWEQVSPEDLAARYAQGMGVYRDILLKWQKDHLTGWREEHDLTSKLVVTRAVCNEVAEHIQHLRGITPPGGLTAKPEWYMRKEKEAMNSSQADKPFLVKPKVAADFKSGASLFWLRWMNKEPNQWQITRPFVMLNGEEIIPLVSDANNSIFSTGSAYQRTVIERKRDENGNMFETSSLQWLRWMHEATIIETTETVDGATVLTFETALPTDDRRQSTIGVFKRFLPELRYNVTASLMIGTFVGYLPEAIPPIEQMRHMLDWNKILLREAYTPEQINQYWQKVTSLVDTDLVFNVPASVTENIVEIAPILRPVDHQELALCYQLQPGGKEISIYQPHVQIKRGTRPAITRLNAVQVADQMYFRIVRCDAEPRAQDLYIDAREIIDVPETGASAPVQARHETHLWRISGSDYANRPIFQPIDAALPADTRLRISTIHTANPAIMPAKNGAIKSSGKRQFFLVHACPRFASAEGLFVQVSDVRKISESSYAKERLSSL